MDGPEKEGSGAICEWICGPTQNPCLIKFSETPETPETTKTNIPVKPAISD